jgi:hypothetical protein
MENTLPAHAAIENYFLTHLFAKDNQAFAAPVPQARKERIEPLKETMCHRVGQL